MTLNLKTSNQTKNPQKASEVMTRRGTAVVMSVSESTEGDG